MDTPYIAQHLEQFLASLSKQPRQSTRTLGNSHLPQQWITPDFACLHFESRLVVRMRMCVRARSCSIVHFRLRFVRDVHVLPRCLRTCAQFEQ
jgi:hypothetical protein